VTPAASRTWLFVPASRPDLFAKAAASGADEILLDLEDAVGDADKPAARQAVARWLEEGRGAWVRVNGPATPWYDGDVAAIRDRPGLAGVMLAKADASEAVARLRAALPAGVGVVPLVESARAVHHVVEIASCGATRLAFGSLDYALDLGCDPVDDALLLARSSLVQASRIAGLPGPLDGVATELYDQEVVESAARYARRLGFGGKLCVHPAQLAAVRAAFAPAPAEVEWARSVLAAAGSGGAATGVDAHLVDKPVLDRARRLLVEVDGVPA